jgi:hypothetical protein
MPRVMQNNQLLAITAKALAAVPVLSLSTRAQKPQMKYPLITAIVMWRIAVTVEMTIK